MLDLKELITKIVNTKSEIQKLEYKLEELEEHKLTVGSKTISDMPRSSRRTDLSNILIRIEEVQEEIIDKQIQSLHLEDQLEKIIAPLTSIERVVIRYRASGVKWENIAKLIDYSLRQSRRIYEEALKKIN